MSTLKPNARIHHLERGYGTYLRDDEHYPYVGQLVAVRFDDANEFGVHESLVPLGDLRHADSLEEVA